MPACEEVRRKAQGRKPLPHCSRTLTLADFEGNHTAFKIYKEALKDGKDKDYLTFHDFLCQRGFYAMYLAGKDNVNGPVTVKDFKGNENALYYFKNAVYMGKDPNFLSQNEDFRGDYEAYEAYYNRQMRRQAHMDEKARACGKNCWKSPKTCANGICNCYKPPPVMPAPSDSCRCSASGSATCNIMPPPKSPSESSYGQLNAPHFMPFGPKMNAKAEPPKEKNDDGDVFHPPSVVKSFASLPGGNDDMWAESIFGSRIHDHKTHDFPSPFRS